jgi:Mor family transcriptional regulator
MFIVLRDSVGERGANAIIGKMMAMFGRQQIYIPLEVGAFEKTIALEIYQRGFTENVPMRVMVRDYNISFNKVYKLWHKGRSIKLREEKRK